MRSPRRASCRLTILVVAMGKLNQEMADAGVLARRRGAPPELEGRASSGSTARRRHRDRRPTSRRRTFGLRLLADRVESKAEAIKWCPAFLADGEEIELRQVFDAADFADIVLAEELAREQVLPRAACARRAEEPRRARRRHAMGTAGLSNTRLGRMRRQRLATSSAASCPVQSRSSPAAVKYTSTPSAPRPSAAPADAADTTSASPR